MRLGQKTIFCIFFIFLTVFANAQEKGQNKKSFIDTERTVFFKNYIGMGKEEEKKFWPVYKNYRARKEKIQNERRNLSTYFQKNKENISDKECREAMSELVSYSKREAGLMGEFQEKFLSILPPKKAIMVFMAEEKFKAYLLKKIRNKALGENPENRPAAIRKSL